MSEELKPCPHCGSDDVILLTAPWHYIHCYGCNMDFGIHNVEEGVTDLWNTRPIEDALRGELAQGVEYVNALVEAMGTEAFLALVDTGKIDGIRAWLETCGEPEEVRVDEP